MKNEASGPCEPWHIGIVIVVVTVIPIVIVIAVVISIVIDIVIFISINIICISPFDKCTTQAKGRDVDLRLSAIK